MDVERRVSLLWLVGMLNTIHADILSITREWMDFPSRVLERGRNRLSNPIAAALTIAFAVGPEIADPGPAEPHHHLLAGAEPLCPIVILRPARLWKGGGAADGGAA